MCINASCSQRRTVKYSKKVLLLPCKFIWAAGEHGEHWLHGHVVHERNLPAIQIGDRDPIWLSAFIQAVFSKLGTRFPATTAYHPQLDGQSERTNQTVEVALRFFTATYPDAEWTEALSYIQAERNNSRNSSTGKIPNVLIQPSMRYSTSTIECSTPR